MGAAEQAKRAAESRHTGQARAAPGGAAALAGEGPGGCVDERGGLGGFFVCFFQCHPVEPARRGSSHTVSRAKLVPLGACPRAVARACILGIRGMRRARRFGSSSLDDPIRSPPRAPRTPRGPLGRHSAHAKNQHAAHRPVCRGWPVPRGLLVGRPRAPRPFLRPEDFVCGLNFEKKKEQEELNVCFFEE